MKSTERVPGFTSKDFVYATYLVVTKGFNNGKLEKLFGVCKGSIVKGNFRRCASRKIYEKSLIKIR